MCVRSFVYPITTCSRSITQQHCGVGEVVVTDVNRGVAVDLVGVGVVVGVVSPPAPVLLSVEFALRTALREFLM